MKAIYKTSLEDGRLEEISEYCDGNCVCLISPTAEEVRDVSEHFEIELQDMISALDEDERARVDDDDDYTLIIIDVPYREEEDGRDGYGTVPLAIILGDKGRKYIITICLRELQLLDDFRNGRIKKFYTYKKTRFIIQLLYRNATYYLQYLRMLERSSGKIEQELHRSTRNEELFQLLSLDKSLVYLSNSLRANELVLERLMRLESVKKYPEDEARKMISAGGLSLEGIYDAFRDFYFECIALDWLQIRAEYTGDIADLMGEEKKRFAAAVRRYDRKYKDLSDDELIGRVLEDLEEKEGKANPCNAIASAAGSSSSEYDYMLTCTPGAANDFVQELRKPDVTVLAEIYAARERNTVGISSKDLQVLITGSHYCKTLPEVTDYLRSIARPGDVILTVGAGDIFRAGEALLK